MTRILVLGLIAVLLAGCGREAQQDEPEPPRITIEDIVAGDLVDVGG
jgi:nitrous oxide reductase accessory protein NosL